MGQDGKLHLHYAYYSRDLAEFERLLSVAAATAAASAAAASSANGSSDGNNRPGTSGRKGKGRSVVDVNLRDQFGRTVLHLAASDGRTDFVEALLRNPQVDDTLKDYESGWTPLHRALYHGHVRIAYIILARETTPVTGLRYWRDLIKIKDRESEPPFDLLNLSIEPSLPALDVRNGQSELLMFGSNVNYNLGFADRDDRTFPEKLVLPTSGKARKQHLPVQVADVQIAKYHTAIITNESAPNLYVCGVASNGRLGISSQNIQFTPAPVVAISQPIATVALGQDHTVAVTTSGDVYSWGSNKYGQLGFSVDAQRPDEDPVQASPRKIHQVFKGKKILMATCSSHHSAVATSTELFTWGRNCGQLGHMGAAIGSVQAVPRKVAAVDQEIVQISATDSATVCLLKSCEIMVFAYGSHAKLTLVLPLSKLGIASRRFMAEGREVRSIFSGTECIGAVNAMGQVFTTRIPAMSFNVDEFKPPSLSKFVKMQVAWEPRKRRMQAYSVAFSQNDTLLVSTVQGAVYLQTRRKHRSEDAKREGKAKDYKFTRLANVHRALKVRTSSSGAIAILRHDIAMDPEPRSEPDLKKDLFSLLPWSKHFKELVLEEGRSEGAERQRTTTADSMDVADTVLHSDWYEKICELVSEPDVRELVLDDESDLDASRHADMVLEGENSLIRCHKAILAARCASFGAILAKSESADYIQISQDAGKLKISCLGISLRALVIFLHYIYTGELLVIWGLTGNRKAFESTKTEVYTLAKAFGNRDLLRSLEFTYQSRPSDSFESDFLKIMPSVSNSVGERDNLADATLRLANSVELYCHATLLCARSEFFSTMFADLGSRWLSSRKSPNAEGDRVSVNLTHLDFDAMQYVIRHVYGAAEDELFSDIPQDNILDYLSRVLDVMACADELLFERLEQVCEDELTKCINLRTLTFLIKHAELFSAERLLDKCLEYAFVNIEILLETRGFESWEDSLLDALSERVQAKQLASFPITRSGILLDELRQRHPDLTLGAPNLSRDEIEFRLTPVPATANYEILYTEKPKPACKPTKTASPGATKGGSDMIFEMEDEDGSSYSDSNTTPRRASAEECWRDARGRPIIATAANTTTAAAATAATATAPNHAFNEAKGPRNSSPHQLSSRGDRGLGNSTGNSLSNSFRTGASPASSSIPRAWSSPQAPQTPNLHSIMAEAAKATKPVANAPPIMFRKESVSGQSHSAGSLSISQGESQQRLPISSKGSGFGQRWGASPASTSPASSLPAFKQILDGESRHMSAAPEPISRPAQFKQPSTWGSSSPKPSMVAILQQEEDLRQMQKNPPRLKSFAEIQQEEEFALWWEAESARVQAHLQHTEPPRRRSNPGGKQRRASSRKASQSKSLM